MLRDCPNCKKPVNWGEQLQDWADSYGEDWDSYCMLAIWCDECEDYAGMVHFEEGELEKEEVDSPALKEKVMVPTGRIKNGK